MKKSKNSVQGLIGLERFTKYGVKTDKAEIAFFSVEPTNISVLSAANIDVKIHHLMMLLSTIPDLEILALVGSWDLLYIIFQTLNICKYLQCLWHMARDSFV